MDIIKKIAEELEVKTSQVDAAVKLIDEGCTIPFIARYRKEVTGALNDEQLRALDDRLKYLRNLEDRKTQVIASIEEQGKLTEELKEQIIKAETMVLVEDLYRPYKQKRRTRATIAKEKGLEPLAAYIKEQNAVKDILTEAAKYISDEEGKEVNSADEAVAGALDIIAEQISDVADYRTYIRDITFKEGKLVVTAKDENADSVYENYYDYNEAIASIPGHRILAINRGESEKFLTVKVEAPKDRILRYLAKQEITADNEFTTPYLTACIEDSYDRLIAPAIEREIRSTLTDNAQDGAIKVFGKNLEQLLLQPPIAGRVVLGWDPGFRNGCKLAIVDATGKVLATKVVYPTEPFNKVEETKKIVADLIKKYGVTLISCGNGTASRESEQIISDMIKEYNLAGVDYVITNEAGASVYSASKLATEEFPDFDVNQRSAVSIARRVQDPLAELVKIDPKSIGVGQYQHDMNQKKLSETLGGVVEDSVNKVGVDLNTASASLLEYISGISKSVAKNIIDYRETNGRFTNRKQLLKVAKLGPKAFEQCAGFMRITGGDNPFDATSVHPESYEAAAKLLKVMGYDINQISSGRDPRDEMPKPILRKDVLDMKDLTPGMILKGTVRNVIDFGAFVDIGVHQDGLVHISQMSAERRIEHPLDIVSVGDIVDVRVIDVDTNKGRISLSMILDEKEAANRSYKNNSDKNGDKKNNKNNGSRNNKNNAGRKSSKQQGLNLRGLEKFMH